MALVAPPPPAAPSLSEKFAYVLQRWLNYPALFVSEAIGADPDPWQCDALDAVYDESAGPHGDIDAVAIDNVAVRACHGVGKTALEAWLILHFTMLHQYCKVPCTAPTFNKQVRDVLFGEIHYWFDEMRQRSAAGRWLADQFEMTTVRLEHKTAEKPWFAVGIASSKPINAEGYHAPHLLAVFDEAKGISKATFDAIQGMRTTQRAKLFVASTPGGPTGEFFRIFEKYRATWKKTFVVHPEWLRKELKRPEVQGHDPETGAPTSGMFALGGTYYSARIQKDWIDARRLEWGADSPVFIARCRGDFPDLAEDRLIQYSWFTAAESREEGAQGGEVWVSCDVARYGRDRTVAFAGRGGTVLAGETIARTPEASSAPEAKAAGAIGEDPKRPLYRSVPATCDFLERFGGEHGAQGFIIDDTGLGGGVSDEMRKRGYRVLPIEFGAGPTDKPKTEDQRKYKRVRGLPETYFFNLKAQLGWALRNAFEAGQLALGRLPDHLLEPLRAQATLMKYEITEKGLLRLLDPDQGEEEEAELLFLGEEERKKSPDHFHSLMLCWWACGSAARLTVPQAQAILPRNILLGRPRAELPVATSLRKGVAGPAAYLSGLYRR